MPLDDIIRHRDGTVHLCIENLDDDATPGHPAAWNWFLSLTPEERATVIIRAYLDISCEDIGDRDGEEL